MNINIKSGALLYEIKSFYRTFVFLKEKNDARIENLGKNDQKSIKEYLELDLYFPSYVVNSCFLAELELKFLLSITGVEFKESNKGHDLGYLYNIICKTNKNELKIQYQKLLKLYQEKTNYSEDLIKSTINLASYTYRDFRYMWERKAFSYHSYFMDIYIDITYRYIIDNFAQYFPQ